MTKTAAGSMAADEFERVANTCRWSIRSLNVAKALLVDGLSPADVAQAQTPPMTPQQANVLKKRFQDKAIAESKKKVSAADFMQAVKPEGDIALEPFRRELVQLRKNGYTAEQLLRYLLENGIDISETALDQFLNKANKNANTRTSKQQGRRR